MLSVQSYYPQKSTLIVLTQKKNAPKANTSSCFFRFIDGFFHFDKILATENVQIVLLFLFNRR